ncbi:carcinine hydrolase/isopenicillin-N N-acyltransferase family protein [Rhodoblastus sp.]|jgi:hypothetical protein|uniref:carcinine hydrolase/isopenicillin-N N-acyltransferase family protein n=1 Tax=Rhodoblastus sp. TaxID=1962975 RepID=UPI0025DBCE23|nr:carcinine hydrolase/isopenicillin-N N-acyltransferase family protein [Rhodoblastus sp.]
MAFSRSFSAPRDLLNIPVVIVQPGDEPALATLAAEPRRFEHLVTSARRLYTPCGVRLADNLSRRWASHNESLYQPAVESVAAEVGRSAAYLLNHSYEWGCTSGAAVDSELGGATLLRTLDWPFDGLGETVVATRCEGAAGPYLSLTWPGLVGVLTATAPGRFAAAINQPPLPGGCGRTAGWLLARYRVGRSKAPPPTHVLRYVFDTARTFDQAVAMLRETPLCIPAIFTIVGVAPHERVVIERTETCAFIASQPTAANHWASDSAPKTRPRDKTSLARRAAMNTLIAKQPDWSLSWLKPPILDLTTRLVVMANPVHGRMIAQGWERSGAVTRPLRLEA